jgi:amino acid transporter
MNSSEKTKNIPAPPPGELGKAELYSLSIGQVIGAGIITLIGPAVALTGQSTWLAYFAAIILGFFLIMPILFLTSTLRLGGGYYSIIAGLAGVKPAGMYAVAFLTQPLTMSLFGVSIGVYAESLWPSLNGQLVGIAFLTFFFVVNLFGVNIMAKVQKWMTVFLLAALLVFIFSGITKIQNPVFDFTAPDFFSHGASGFISAVYLFSYSTYGYALTMSYGKDAKNAKRDIPWAIIAAIPTLIILYCGVAIVGTGVLPLSEVENKPLTDVAKVILSKPLFVFFMIGGPIMALMTTMNSSMAYYAIPIQQSCVDGWFPKEFAAKNRYGVSWKIMTVIYLVGLIPLVLGFDINTITKNIMLLNSVLSLLYSYAYYQLPKKYPEAWAKSKLHMPNWAYYLMVTVSLIAYITVFIDSMSSLTPVVAIVSITVIVCCMIFGFVRSKNPDVQVETSMWED